MVSPPVGDKSWLLQINKPRQASRNTSGCHVFGFWLDELATPGRQFVLLSPPVRVYYGSIIKTEDQTPLVIPVQELTSGWQSGHLSLFAQSHSSHSSLLRKCNVRSDWIKFTRRNVKNTALNQVHQMGKAESQHNRRE